MQYLEKHEFTYLRPKLSTALLVLGFPVWMLSTIGLVAYFMDYGVAVGMLATFGIVPIFCFYMYSVMPRLARANGEARLYEDFMELQLRNKTYQIYYKDIYRLKFCPEWYRGYSPRAYFQPCKWQ